MGNPLLRSLLVVGATSVLRVARNNPQASPWIAGLLARRPSRVATVALANKMARIIWALLVRGSVYRAPSIAQA
jgi:transposase